MELQGNKTYQKRVTLKEMAQILGRCERTFLKYVVEYKIPHIRLGRDRLFDVSEVENHLKNLTMETLNAEMKQVESAIKTKSKINSKHSGKSKNKYANLLGLS